MRTRLAPSPTGALHIGNARTFLMTWLHARYEKGTILLRIDDLDGPRVKPGADKQALEDLKWLGLDWDEGPDLPVLRQSERTAIYDAACDKLVAAGQAYPCICTRKEVEKAASAPHGPEGTPYPGTCRGKFESLEHAKSETGRDAALRFVVPAGPVEFHDEFWGPQSVDVAAETGDFPIRKRDGCAAYQLATVIDDAETGIDTVIRGKDLLPSTARQILLQQALGLPRPTYWHHALVVGPDGRRLAKRHGDSRIAFIRELGYDPQNVVGWIAAESGLAAMGARATPSFLVQHHHPGSVSVGDMVVDPAQFTPGPAAG